MMKQEKNTVSTKQTSEDEKNKTRNLRNARA
jgi:hypothetical protein